MLRHGLIAVVVGKKNPSAQPARKIVYMNLMSFHKCARLKVINAEAVGLVIQRGGKDKVTSVRRDS